MLETPDLLAIKNWPGSFVNWRREVLEIYATESLSLVCVETGFLFDLFVNMVSKYKFAFQPVCASIQPAATTSDKANQTRSPGEVGGEQTFDVTHIWVENDFWFRTDTSC